jgi:predicted nucleic acid-binding protein
VAHLTPVWLRQAAKPAHIHSLSFYDASWAATAAELGIPLISADRRLLTAGLAESPDEITTRLKLSLK